MRGRVGCEDIDLLADLKPLLNLSVGGKSVGCKESRNFM